MIINITMNTKKPDEVFEYAQNLHNSLAGNQNYIDSNIVLIFDNSKDPQTCNLYIDANACKDKEYIRTKAKAAIDLFIDTL